MDFRVVFLLVGCPKCPLLRVVWLVVCLSRDQEEHSERGGAQRGGERLCRGHRACYTEAGLELSALSGFTGPLLHPSQTSQTLAFGSYHTLPAWQ